MRTAKSVWPFAPRYVQAVRPGVAFSELGNHATYQDFMDALPGATADVRHHYPLGKCPGDIFLSGGRACARSDTGDRATCTPMVTWVQEPAKRFVSSFFEHYGRGNPLARASALSRRYDLGTITPDEFARWGVQADLAHFVYDNPAPRRNYVTWNIQTQYLGDTTLHRYQPRGNRWGVDPQSPRARAMLSLAKRRLAAMDFVGLASRFSESMALLSWSLGLPPLNITCSSNVEHKVGLHPPNLTTSAPPLGLSAEGKRAIQAQNQLDLELYEYAKALFEARWARFQREAPERFMEDRYNHCHRGTELHCLPVEVIHSPFYSGRQRCTTYCTNEATQRAHGEVLREAYLQASRYSGIQGLDGTM
jgi:hypothetical protein